MAGNGTGGVGLACIAKGSVKGIFGLPQRFRFFLVIFFLLFSSHLSFSPFPYTFCSCSFFPLSHPRKTHYLFCISILRCPFFHPHLYLVSPHITQQKTVSYWRNHPPYKYCVCCFLFYPSNCEICWLGKNGGREVGVGGKGGVGFGTPEREDGCHSCVFFYFDLFPPSLFFFSLLILAPICV